MASVHKIPYTLYFYKHSICSLMVLYTLAIRGKPIDSETDMDVRIQDVDIFREEQLDEHFLCEINAKGQVPVLANPAHLQTPIPDSLDITFHLASKHPDLMPPEHEPRIRQLLIDLHALNYFSLSFPDRPQVAHGIKVAIIRRLESPGISERYRKALEYKLTILVREKVEGIIPSEVVKMEKLATDLLSSLNELAPDVPGQWLFGEKPTALDAHLLVFMARMREVGRQNLIPERLEKYASWAMESREWKEIMEASSFPRVS